MVPRVDICRPQSSLSKEGIPRGDVTWANTGRYMVGNTLAGFQEHLGNNIHYCSYPLYLFLFTIAPHDNANFQVDHKKWNTFYHC